MMTPGPVNLLLIEDRTEYAVMLRTMLTQGAGERFQMEHVQTLSEGIARLRKGGIHLVLLDLGLPDSVGFQTFARIAAAAPEVPIIVLSSDSEEALAVQTVHHGAQDYLVKKHTDHHALVRAVRYALERKTAQLALERAQADLERRVADRTAELTSAKERLEREVSERVRAEEALRESNCQLSEALGKLRETQEHIIQRERLHALGRMASGIAHDFNNALAPILGFSELLLLRPEIHEDRETVRSYLEMIHTAAQDSAKVVARLREFYRYREETEVFAPVSLNDLIQQVISLTQPKWKDQAMAHGVNIKIKTELGNIPSVYGNEAELREMLANLLFNAVDAISDAGEITFRTYSVGDDAVLQLTDNGMGMTEEVRSRCLEPFFSTKEEHGTGLGLGIVYGTVRRHEGRIELESAPGEGTCVTITLPLYREQDTAELPSDTGPAKHPLRVLVVEDEPLVRELISVYLSEDRHHVEVAENGREGLEKFRAGKFDIVLTDRAMPEMNGDQLAAAVKAINPEMPVVLLTGFGDLMTDAGERPAGVDLIVSKPFTLGTLRQAIAKVLPKVAQR
jgi:signal transduction histidine kinase